jgi:hypothetical protein
MPRLLYNALVEKHERYCEETDVNVQLFLGATIRDDSHASLLRGMDDVLKEIHSYLIPPGRKPLFAPDAYMYSVNVPFCGSYERNCCEVSALENCGLWRCKDFNKPPNVDLGRTLWSGSLETFLTNTPSLLHRFMTIVVVYTRRNQDDSYWNEMQLREQFREFARITCNDPELCCGRCGLLQGDTITWEFKDLHNRQVKGFQPASKEELQERGYWLMDPHHKECSDEECLGRFEAVAASARRAQAVRLEEDAVSARLVEAVTAFDRFVEAEQCCWLVDLQHHHQEFSDEESFGRLKALVASSRRMQAVRLEKDAVSARLVEAADEYARLMEAVTDYDHRGQVVEEDEEGPAENSAEDSAEDSEED